MSGWRKVVANDMEGGGKVAVGTSPVEVTFSEKTRTQIVRADKDNAGILYVGKSDVLSDGSNAVTYLSKGDIYIQDYDDSLNPMYVVASEASQNFWKGATR